MYIFTSKHIPTFDRVPSCFGCFVTGRQETSEAASSAEQTFFGMSSREISYVDRKVVLTDI